MTKKTNIHNDITELSNSIKEMLDSKCLINLYFIINDIPYIVNKKDDDELNKDLMEKFKSKIKEVIEQKEFISDISDSDSYTEAIYRYDLDKSPDEFIYMKAINEKESEIKKFNFNENEINQVSSIIIAIKNTEKSIILYKKNYPISLLKRENLMIFKSKDRFEKVNSDILKIDINFQFFLYEDQFYILDIDKLDKILGISDLLIEEAKKSIRLIEKKGLVEDISNIEAEIEDLTLARKLMKAGKNNIILESDISNEDIVNFTKEHKFFEKNKIKSTADGKKFILDTKKSVSSFIKLLNDEFLKSDLTNLEYESKAKLKL